MALLKRLTQNDIHDITEEKKEDFLKEIEEVCKKHNLSISHEDSQGAFEIEKYHQQNIEWLKDADFYTGT